jgi:hypothetical protein
MTNMMGAGILSDCPTIRGLRKYHSTICMTSSIARITITILQPVYSTIPAKRIGMPLIKTPNIGTKLVKNVIHPRASR